MKLFVLNTPSETCIARNDGSVPDDIIIRMDEQLKDMLQNDAFQKFSKVTVK